jgi:hypothetical protein
VSNEPDYANAKVIYGPLHRDTLVQLLAERDAALAARPSPARDKVLEEAAQVADRMAAKAKQAGEAEAVSEVDERYRERVDAAVVAELAYEAMATGIRALKAQPPSTVGEDATAGEFVMVPREPTDHMTAAGVAAGVSAAPDPWCPAVWRAMLDAAPKPTQPSIGMDERDDD